MLYYVYVYPGLACIAASLLILGYTRFRGRGLADRLRAELDSRREGFESYRNSVDVHLRQAQDSCSAHYLRALVAEQVCVSLRDEVERQHELRDTEKDRANGAKRCLKRAVKHQAYLIEEVKLACEESDALVGQLERLGMMPQKDVIAWLRRNCWRK